jgi:murein DD-endopeptidase MepM/ murein hydrolase activator NlpD
MNKSLPQFETKNRKVGEVTPQRLRKVRKDRLILVVAVFILFSSGFFLWKINNKKEPKEMVITQGVTAEIKEKTHSLPQENIISHIIAEGDIPADVFGKYGKMNANTVESLLIDAEDVYDFTKLKIGQKIEFVFDDKEEVLEKIRYYQNSEQMIVAMPQEDDFEVIREDIPYEKEVHQLFVKIDEFLYKDALDAGLSEASILEIADILSYDIDFTTEIREGDELSVVYEKRTYRGEPAPDGNVLAAKFTNAGQDYYGYYFEIDGEGSHYDGDGKELVRQFLRAPLSYRKITSGYTGARLHPITKKVTAHYQIDYAAPIGTPVVATARGNVTGARYEGGWGNIVRLKHDNGYTTHYAHLSRYAKGVRVGASVSQGQTIGYVGSTGWSTGPHLDYGMRLNGAPINPLSLKLPKGTPLTGEKLEKFQEVKRDYEEKLK